MNTNTDNPQATDSAAAEKLAQISDLPAPPSGSVFTLVKIDKISLPHPFMITPRHVAFAADHRGGMLTSEAIDASRAPCGWRGCNLKASEHETQTTLFIAVPQNRDLNAVPGLHAYLVAIKDKATALGIGGFAFPIGGFAFPRKGGAQ